MPDIGNIFDSVLKPEWLAVVHGVEALATNVEGEVKTELQTAQGQLSIALTTASGAVTAAQSQIDNTVNPLVNKGLQAAAAAIGAAYPPFAALVNAAEPEVQTLADGGTDAIALAAITALAKLLSQSAKTVAAVNLSNIAGAV